MSRDELALTPEEAELIRKARAEQAAESADLLALQAILPRAKSPGERHELEKMIERRGGPAAVTCKCGGVITHASLGECDDCYQRGYGK